MTSRALAGIAASAALLLAPASAAAQAPETVDLEAGGKTVLKLSKQARSGVTYKASKGASKRGSRISFPITGGDVDPVDLNPADVNHRGWLTIRLGRRGPRVVLKKPELVIGRKSKLNATVRGKRVPVLNLSLARMQVTRQGFESTDAAGISAKLSRAGARAFNRATGTRAFRKGTKVGTISTDTQAAEALIDGSAGNRTRLVLEGSTAGQFASNGISASEIAPATHPNALTFEFPVIGGTLDIDSIQGTGPLQGQIQHAGGILFQKGGTQLPLTDLFFELKTPPATPTISVLFGAGRVDAADLDVSAATKSIAGNQVTFNGSVAKVNAASSAVLQAQFGVTIPPGTPIGTNSVTVTLK